MPRIAETATFSNLSYFQDRGPHGCAQPITERINPHSRPIVSYYFPKDVGAFHYGEHHPMKPHRLTLTNALVLGYGLDKQLHNIYDVRSATDAEIEVYHDHDYIEYLKRVTPQNQSTMKDQVDAFNCGDDCPVFTNMYQFGRMYAGASLAAAHKLCAGTTDIAINWSGGLHHAKRGEASGFCYVNDIVLAILELLRFHPRVLYIDIDIHHGDGVEFAFYQSDRVMTLSFHKYTGDFFPGTGKLDDNGHGRGKHFCLNVPLLDGIDDEMYLNIFRSVVENTVTTFQPAAIVLQCGADSLGCDRLGAFNLSIAAHGECVNFVRKFNKPMLVVGGGGYTIKNVSRCWTYETSVLVGASIPNELPTTVYDSFFEESQWKLHPPLTGKVDNQNTVKSLQNIKSGILTKLRYLQGAPSVMMQEIPPNIQGLLENETRTAEEKTEELGTAAAGEHKEPERMAVPNDYYDGEKDVDKTSTPSVGRARGRRGGRPRGRGRGSRGGKRRARARDDSDDDSDESQSSSHAPPPSRRGRGRGRGGRGRGKYQKVRHEESRSPPSDSVMS